MAEPDPETKYVTVGLTKAARAALDTTVLTISSQLGRRLSRSETIIEIAERLTQKQKTPETNPVMGICGEGGRYRSCMALDPDGTGCGSTYPRPAED